MLNDADILSTLTELFGEHKRQSIVSRLYRLPEIWDALHDASFLSSTAEKLTAENWLPGRIVAQAYGHDDLTALAKDGLVFDGDNPVSDMGYAAACLKDVAALSIQLLAKSKEPESREDVAQAIEGNPGMWTTALACVWPDLMATTWLKDYLPSPPSSMHARMIATALLANLDVLQAAQALVSLDKIQLASLLPALQTAGYEQLFTTLGQLSIEKLAEIDVREEVDPSPAWITPAMLLAVSGDTEGAHQAFRQAWDRSNETSAKIADRLAEVARQTGDPVLELEARRQAVESSTSEHRRAALARSLYELNRDEEALQILTKPDSVVEMVVAGALYNRIGNRQQATAMLLQASTKIASDSTIGDDWKCWLVEQLAEIGELNSAIDVQQARCEGLGTQKGMMLELARLHSRAGNPDACAACAEVAVALDPSSRDSLQLLAESLQKSGQPRRALSHWLKISQQDSGVWAQVSRCAIEAGEASVALTHATEALKDAPDSVEAQVLIGKSHVLNGDYETARTYLERAVDQAPAQADAWIALAEAQSACGDDEASGETLQKAVQSAAGDGKVHMAFARWLRVKGQLSMALDHVRVAVGIDPGQSEWRIEQAEILRDLGKIDEALPELRAALAAQPGNWRAREALALTYELKNELPAAAHVLRRIPDNIEPDSKLIAGRILVKSSDASSHDQLQQATELLVAAREQGVSDNSLWYWLALAYERSGLTAQAVEAFHAYLEETGSEKQPLKLDAFVGFARTAIETDQIQRAIDKLEIALREFPASHQVLSNLAKTYLSSDRSQDAEQVARQAVELEPDNVESLQTLRDAVLAQNKTTEAISLQEQILAKDPQDINALRQLSEIEYSADQVERAQMHLAKAVSIGRNDATVLLSLSETAKAFGRERLAHGILKRGARIEPENEEILASLAETSESLADLETAQSSWLQYATLRKNEPRPLERAAQALWKLGRRTAAIGLWERALDISDQAELHLALAEGLRLSNQPERSLDHYRAAAEKSGGDPSILIPVSEALYELGQIEESENILSTAGSNQKTPAGVSILQAKHALERSDFEKADHKIKQAKALSGESTIVRTLELQLAQRIGKRQVADRELKSLLNTKYEDDRECLAAVDAALSVNAWGEAVAFLATYLESHPLTDTMAQKILILSHRVRDLDWLYASVCEATNHTPTAAAQGVEQLVEQVKQLPAGVPSIIESLVTTWEAIQTGAIEAEVFDGIYRAPKSAQLMLLEAGAIALLKANRPARALELVESAVNTGPGQARRLLLKGIAETMLKRFEPAIQTFDEAAADPIHQPLAFYLQSETYRKYGRQSEALSKLNAALALWPDESNWHFKLAQEYVAADHIDAALPHLQQAAEIEPANGEYMVALARAYNHVGQTNEALNCYALGLQSAPKSAGIWRDAGEVALAAGDLASAEAWLERACTLAPSDAICAIQSARTALARGDMKAALKRGQAAVRMQPDDAEVLSGMGEILAADGKFEKAIQMYDIALKSEEENLTIRLARGRLLAKSGRSSEAAAELESIINSAPDHDQAWASLARAQIESGKLEQALEAANHAHNLSPRNVQYMLLLGQVCRMNGQLDRALSVLSEASRFASEDADLARELGKVHEMRREHSAALDAYQLALKKNPDDFESLIEAGLILKNIKVYDQAGELFERAVKLNPVDPQALQQLATIRALQLIHGGTRETEAVAS